MPRLFVALPLFAAVAVVAFLPDAPTTIHAAQKAKIDPRPRKPRAAAVLPTRA